jgi:hypothetical protein
MAQNCVNGFGLPINKMEYYFPPVYRDKTFWSVSAVMWASWGSVNFFCFRRPLYKWYRSLAVSLTIGWGVHFITKKFHSFHLWKYHQEQMQEEYLHTQKLASQKGKFLENSEGELKEVFRTIIY